MPQSCGIVSALKEVSVDKVALCVFGVNGVGKSSLLEAVIGMSCVPAVVVRGSTILKESLGFASYEALESMSAEEKKRALLDGMAAVVANTPSSITVVDTHLVVPIRKSGQLAVEDMWDDRMLQLFQGFVYITAQPSTIAERRRMDSGRLLRVSYAIPEICAEDLRLNERRWDEASSCMTNKRVVVNDQTILVGARKISDFIQSLRL